MREEQIKDFTRRISQCNSGEIIVIMYDIAFAYIKDAEDAYAAGEYEGFRVGIQKAGKAIEELRLALNFKYPVSKDLYALYTYAKEELSRAVIRNRLDEVWQAKKVLHELYEAFVEVAKQDMSEPLMKNAQQVYAGMTYGKNNLTEMFQEPETSRGFFA